MELPATLRRPLIISIREWEVWHLARLRRQPREIRDERTFLADVLPKRDVPTSHYVGHSVFRD